MRAKEVVAIFNEWLQTTSIPDSELPIIFAVQDERGDMLSVIGGIPLEEPVFDAMVVRIAAHISNSRNNVGFTTLGAVGDEGLADKLKV